VEKFHYQHSTNPQPQQGMTLKLMKRFRETGSVADRYRSDHWHTSTDQDHVVTELAKVATSHHRSMRNNEEEAGISHTFVHRILQ
jgi:hypothetical protein